MRICLMRTDWKSVWSIYAIETLFDGRSRRIVFRALKTCTDENYAGLFLLKQRVVLMRNCFMKCMHDWKSGRSHEWWKRHPFMKQSAIKDRADSATALIQIMKPNRVLSAPARPIINHFMIQYDWWTNSNSKFATVTGERQTTFWQEIRILVIARITGVNKNEAIQKYYIKARDFKMLALWLVQGYESRRYLFQKQLSFKRKFKSGNRNSKRIQVEFTRCP